MASKRQRRQAKRISNASTCTITGIEINKNGAIIARSGRRVNGNRYEDFQEIRVGRLTIHRKKAETNLSDNPTLEKRTVLYTLDNYFRPRRTKFNNLKDRLRARRNFGGTNLYAKA